MRSRSAHVRDRVARAVRSRLVARLPVEAWVGRPARGGEAARVTGIMLLSATKALDLGTTLAMVLTFPGAEVNPIARVVLREAGAGGLVFVAFAIVLAVVLVVEAGAGIVRETTPHHPFGVRVLGYTLLSALWLAVAARNILVITTTLQ